VNEEHFISLMLAQANVAPTNKPSFKIPLSPEQILSLMEKYGLKVLAAICVFAVGLFVAGRVGKLLSRTLEKREMEPPLRMLLIRIAKLAVMLLAVLIAVQQMGIELWPLIAGLGVAGVGIGLAMQGVLSNLVAGLTIIFVKKFRVGEYIEINGVHGQVSMIELFSTTLIHPDMSRVLVPNRKIVGEIIHNYGKIRQPDLSVGVAYDTDLNQALEIVRDILAGNPRVMKEPAPVVGASTLGDSSVVIAIKPWVALADFGPVQAEINKAILERFRQAGISIPFPQREVRILSSTDMKAVA